MLSQDEARDVAYEFLVAIDRDADLERERVRELLGKAGEDANPNTGRSWEFDGPLGNFLVSQSAGKIVGYYAPDSEPTQDAAISQDEAQEIASRFIRKVYAGYDPQRFELQDAKQREELFSFTYRQVPQSGEFSIFPNYARASVRSDVGLVTAFVCTYLDFVRTTPPKISEDQARQIVERTMDEGGELTRLTLLERPSEDLTHATTVWEATVTYGVATLEMPVMILVNADTGETFSPED